MSDWQQSVAGVVERFETRFDRLKRRLGASIGLTGSPLIVPYRSYGASDRLLVMGRVLSNTPAAAAGADDSVWQNLLNTYRRLESDEVPGARVQAQIGDVVAEAVSDEEGYFRIWLEGVSEYTTPGWIGVDLRLREPLDDGQGHVLTRAHVQVPANEAQFGIISDIDDTVMQSHATELLRMAKLTFLGNAHTRLPFPGVAAFYRALVGGGR
ncbi:MAG: phosphatase domain-containing protein, partial [Chloroflexota bacterium]